MEPITDLNAYLEEARQKVEENNAVRARSAELAKQQSELFAELNQEKKTLQNTIEKTVSERRSEVAQNYDAQLNDIQSKLKKVRAERERARNEGIRERISRETEEHHNDIRSLRSQIGTELKNAGLPSFCDSDLFYAVFMPESFVQVLILIAVLALCFFLIPVGIWFIGFKDQGAVPLIIIYVIDIAVFLGLYITISQKTVVDNQSVLKTVRQLRKGIDDDEKKIEAITRNIREDRNESEYNLISYDDDIARLEQQLADVTMKKKDALDTFENVTRNIITDELTNNAKPAMDELERQRAAVSSELCQAETRRNELSMEISNRFESYLGREFMQPDKLEALSDIVRNGTAANISEAIEEYRKGTEA